MRKIVVLLLVGLLVVGLVPLAAAQDEAEPFTMTIMHTNDTHAHHEPDSDGNGGVARQATVVQQIRDEVANTLLLDAGDRFTGTLYHQRYRGSENATIMNLLGYDAMTLGNHEFDDGDETLAAFLTELDFPVVVSNMDFSASDVLADLVLPYTVLEVGGEQVGIIGLITPETDILSSPGEDLVFDVDLAGAAQAAVDELTGQGVNKIIALTHIGYRWDTELAGQVSGVDIIIGGHDNTLLSNVYANAAGPYPVELESASGEPVLVVQAYTETVYLGRLDVAFDDAGVLTDWEGDTILLSRYIMPDPVMQDLVDELAGPIEELKQTPVGETAVYLVGDRSVCRVAECNLGNLIADALRMETDADVALQNGGGIRADIPEGEVTLGQVLTVLPFGNLVSTMSLSGADLWDALENGVSQVEDVAGRFLQVSGLRYTWDASQPPGSRIVSAEVLNPDTGEYEPLDLEELYFVATNDFMRNGGDGYAMFAENALNPYDFGSPLDAVVADYIKANSPVAPEVEGRITRLN